MRNIKVMFTLNDEHEERLRKILEKYKNELNLDATEEKMFEYIMQIGSAHDIDTKFKFHEWKLGLREDFR